MAARLKQVSITQADLVKAGNIIARDPKKYADAEIRRALAVGTPGRYRQRRLAAGRDGLVRALFEMFPDLGSDHHRLTAAIRRGCGLAVDFELINEMGAVRLGLPKELAK